MGWLMHHYIIHVRNSFFLFKNQIVNNVYGKMYVWGGGREERGCNSVHRKWQGAPKWQKLGKGTTIGENRLSVESRKD